MNCSQLYAGTDFELPEVQSEAFSVERVAATDEGHSNLLRICGTSHVYYLAPHTGCGCGWEYLGNDTEWDLRNLDSAQRLATYLREQTSRGDILVLSSCSETLSRTPDERARLSVDAFLPQFQAWRVRYSTAYAKLVELTVGT